VPSNGSSKSKRDRQRAALGAFVRDARIAARLSQDEVAAGLSWSRSRVSALENGRAGLPVEDVPALCRLLGTTASAFSRRLDLALSQSQRSTLSRRAMNSSKRTPSA
jgi:transcriptional regulator with XRE-family HTH domain